MIKLISALGLLAILSGCGTDDAKANGGCTATNFNASDGARCYVIYCDGKAIGGNCQ